MTTSDYLIDSLLVLLVVLQMRETKLTTTTMLRPLVIVAVAVMNYLHGIPTAGNDLVLIGIIGSVGASLGIASGLAVKMRVREDGAVTARAGWTSAALWVVGMGSRFAFVVWLTHAGMSSITHFSAAHSITTPEAWTVALLAMAVAEVTGRTLVMGSRRLRLERESAHAAPALPAVPVA